MSHADCRAWMCAYCGDTTHAPARTPTPTPPEGWTTIIVVRHVPPHASAGQKVGAARDEEHWNYCADCTMKYTAKTLFRGHV